MSTQLGAAGWWNHLRVQATRWDGAIVPFATTSERSTGS